jgi:hypothetical protein
MRHILMWKKQSALVKVTMADRFPTERGAAMDFRCDRCGQKHRLADERIQGRATVKARCQRCQNVVDVSSTKTAPPSRPAVPAPPSRPSISAPTNARAAIVPPPPPRPAAMPAIARTSLRAQAALNVTADLRVPSSAGSMRTAAALKLPLAPAHAPARPVAQRPAPRVAPPPPPPRTALVRTVSPTLGVVHDTGWYAGLRDVPVGPMTRAQIEDRIVAGEITPETRVYREGWNDWRTLRDVVELAESVRRAARRVSIPAPPSAPAEPYTAPVPAVAVAAHAQCSPTPAAVAEPAPTASAAVTEPTPLATAVIAPPAAEPAPSRAVMIAGLPIGAWLMMLGVGVLGVGLGLSIRRAEPPARRDVPAVHAIERAERAVARTPAALASSPAPHIVPAPIAPRSLIAPSPHVVHATRTRALALLPAIEAPQSSAPEATGPTGNARAEQVLAALAHTRVLGDCWNSALRRNPVHPREAFRVELDVRATGRAAARVIGASDAALAQCIEQRAAYQLYGAGQATTVAQSVELSPGG